MARMWGEETGVAASTATLQAELYCVLHISDKSRRSSVGSLSRLI